MLRWVFHVVSFFLCAGVLLWGQGTTSRAVGIVTDSTGAAIAGAKVTLTNEATGAAFSTVTSESGNYQLEAIQIGVYRLEVESAGFRKFVSPGNQVTIGTPMTLNVSLEVGQVTETIEVSGAAELVQTSQSGNLGPVINERLIKEMPIVATRRRDPTSILEYVPGMNNGANTGSGGHLNGSRDRAWNFTLDGIDMNEVSAGGGVGNNPIRVNPDSVAEMKIVTSNASAEFGRNSGGQVALVTRSGTNELHGNLFWFYRTPGLNANRWQDNLDRVGKQKFIQHIFGGSVGGPIVKNRTFYFGNWQELRAIRSLTQTATVLTQQARNGIFRYALSGQNRPAGTANASVDFSGNPIVPVGSYNIVQSDPQRLGIDPAVKALIDLTPLPNRFDAAGDGLNFAGLVFRPNETEEQRDLTAKFDHILNDRNTIFGRIYWGKQNTLCDGVNSGLPRYPGGPCLVNTYRLPRNYAVNWRSVLTPSITNEFVAGWSEFFFDFPNPVRDITRPTLLSPPGTGLTIPVEYVFANTRKLSTLQFVENFSWLRGRHAIKVGANLRLTRHEDDRGSIGGQNAGMRIDFDPAINAVSPDAFGLPAGINQSVDRPALESTINFLLGRVGRFNQGFVAQGDQFRVGTFQFDSRYNEIDLYIQDTFKVSKRLTVDLGLRLDARLAPSSAGQQPILTPNQAVAVGAAPSNTLRWGPGRDLYRSDWNNWGPSVGLAYDPFGDGRTSLRTNYRLAYDRMPTFLLSSAVFPAMPGSVLGEVNQTFGAQGGRLRNLPSLTPTRRPAELAQPAPFTAQNNTVVDPNLETAQTHMWSFGVQREIVKNTVLEVNYLGRRATNLLGAYNINQVDIYGNGFADAFRTVQAGGESALMNRIYAADSRRRAGETGAQFLRRQFATQLRNNDVAGLALQTAQRPQSGTSLVEASGLSPFFFIPYPQMAGGLTVIDSNDFSTYHGLQMTLNRRFANGANVNVAYTWSKSLDTRSYDPVFTVAPAGSAQSASSSPQDIYNRKLNYALSDFDRTHTLNGFGVWELPVGRGKPLARDAGPVLQRLIGGFQVSGLFRATSGRPFSVFAGANTFFNGPQAYADCSACTRALGQVREEQGLKWYFDPTERAKFSIPAAGTQGNTGRNFFRGDRFINLDFSLSKKTQLSERMQLELRADFLNLTNTPSFGFPTAVVTSGIFGRIRADVVSVSRQTMLGAKLNF